MPGTEMGRLNAVDQRARDEALAAPISYSGHERDRFFHNLGGGRFRPVAYSVGLDDDADGRANVALDYDGDGDLDLAVLSLQKLRLLENRSPERHHFIRFDLRATRSEHHALGAVVQVRSESHEQMDYVTATSGFASAVPLSLHFGLGSDDVAQEVRVTWPSGHVDTYVGVAADQRWLLLGGRDTPERAPLIRWSSRLEDSAITREFTLPESLRSLAGEPVSVPSPTTPTVVNLWASWCVACRSELPELARLARERDDISFVGISLDEDAAAARAFVSQYAVDFPNYLADDEVLTRFLSAEPQAVRLPASFVLDARGHLRRAFFRQVSASDIEAALRTIKPVRLAAGDGQLLAARGLQKLQLGKKDEAIELLSEAVRLDPAHVPAQNNLAAAYVQAERLDDAVAALEALLEHQPDHTEAHLNLGTLLHELDRHADAIESFRRAHELDSGSELARYYLASCLIEEGRMGDATDVAESWLAETPGNPDAQKLLQALNQMRRRSKQAPRR